MTLWNPLNVFSSSQRRVGTTDPVASFDPSRTGDPLGPGFDRPAIGFGETRVDEAAGWGEPRRRPIGFAPPEETTDPRYRTEISFKRHHELPRASATAAQLDDAPREPWQTPANDPLETIPVSSASSFDVEEADVVPDVSDPDALPAAAEEKVPFFKREISFRRKRTADPEPTDADPTDSEAEGDEVPVELVADAGEPAEIDEFADEPSEATDVEVLASVDEEPAAEPAKEAVAESDVDSEEPAADGLDLETVPDLETVSGLETVPDPDTVMVAAESDTKVPFYKRELSFRRKAAAAAAAVTVEQQADEVAVDDMDVTGADPALASWDVPAAASVVPEAQLESKPNVQAEVEEPGDEAVEELHESESGEADEPIAEIAAAADESAELSSDAVEEAVPAEGTEPTAVSDEEHSEEVDAAADPLPIAIPVRAWDDDAESGDLPTDDGQFIEDTPPPAKSRFARKEKKSGDSLPKRKQTRGGKGAKGRRVVGLKIGASQIAAAVLVEAESGHELVQLARRPLASGIVVDGEVKDLDALSHAVKAFFDEEKLPKKDVRIGLASNRIGVRTFDIVGIDDEAKFDNAVRFKAHEVLPVAAHESVLDYRVLEERPNEAGEPMRRVLLVVAPRDQVEPYAELASRAGIKLAGIDLEALGLLRAFVEPKPFAVRAVDDTATVVVAIGHESSTLLVSGGGTCEFTRVFDWGGSALEEAIATTLEVRPAEAATILRHLSLSGPGRQFEGLDEASRAKALDAVRLRLTPFARELVASLQFYQTQAESLGIGGILITGGTSHLEGLADALHQMIGVNVAVGDPLARVRHTAEYDPAIEAVIGSMAVPIGLAIDDLAMRGVDLLPKGAVRSGRRLPDLKKVAVPVAVAVPLVALGFLYLGAHGKVADTSAELDAVKAEIATLPEPQGPDIDASVVGDEAARATAIASVLGGRLAWDAVFRDLARVLPANVWLASLSATLPEGGVNLASGATTPVAAAVPGQPPPAPTAVLIDGYTYTQPDVARLLARLTTLPSLSRVTLTSSRQEKLQERNVIRFSIVADLSETGGPS